MELKGILSISGKPGLFKLVKQAHNSIIVESLANKRRMPAYATSKVSSLEDIAVFTETGDMPLREVFKSMYKITDGKKAIDHKADREELFGFFAEVLPEYDRDKVYHSDIKRIINWYNILVEYGLMEFSEEEMNENENIDEPESNKEESTDNETEKADETEDAAVQKKKE